MPIIKRISTEDHWIDHEGFELLKSSEGLKLTTYTCSAGKATIGYGHTGADVAEGMCITQERADQLLTEDCRWVERAIRDLVEVRLSQGEYNALVSFIYNIGRPAFGESTLLRLLNADNYIGAGKEFKRWVKADGRTIEGLVNRRKADEYMWNTGKFRDFR